MTEFPSPLKLILDPISIVVIAMYVLLYIWENLFPRNKALPPIKHATVRGLIAFGIFFYLSSYLPLLTDEFLARYQLIDLSGLHIFIQIFIGLSVYQFFLYCWHRVLHQSDMMWRVFHQMHHSSERIDIPSTFYFSPSDMIGFTLLGSLVFAFLMGVSAQAATAIILTLNFLSIFQHANIATPQWLGYLIQRPEQHAVHHQRGAHKYNYSDFPLYDLVFGTFRNPKVFKKKNGFYDGASKEIWNMLKGRDITKMKGS